MAKPTRHVMLDIETLSLAVNAAVFQVGIAYYTDDQLVVKQHTIPPKQFLDGKTAFDVNENTIKFHKDIGSMNFGYAMECEGTTEDLARFILESIEDATEGGKYTVTIWCCGTDFDIPRVTYLLDVHNLKPSWSHSMVRDYRTLRELHKEEVPRYTKNVHSAGLDAEYQLIHLRTILEYLDKWS